MVTGLRCSKGMRPRPRRWCRDSRRWRQRQVLAPVGDLLLARAGTALDIGAGTGRDAAWLARRGHRVLAVEPVAALRSAGEALHRMANLEWLDDGLPELARARARGGAST